MPGNPGLLGGLPAQVSSFIGREAELAAVRALVGGSRLVTLNGAGGAAKTRLGLQVAAGLAGGAGEGVWFADLAPVGDPDLVAVTVADVLGVRQEPGRPVLDTLVAAVGGGSLLVVLDNCEHVIGACARLAAARLRVLPPTELEARLDQRFALLTGGSRAGLARQQTLWALVDWSWELLAGAERTVLAALSVFAGGFGLAAAEAVAAGPDVPAAEVLGHLGALVDKSLVQFGDAGASPGRGRYRLLETVRQYAAGKLDAQGTAAVRAARMAHREYYLALTEAAAPQLVAADQAAWLDRLDAEQGNLRAAIAFSQAQPDPAPGLRLAASLHMYWAVRGHAAEGAGGLRALLDAPGAQEATLPRARALAAAAHILDKTSGYTIAGDYCQEALAIARAAGDEHLVADLLYKRAWILLRQGQPGSALPLIESGLGLARRLGEPRLTGRLLSARSYVAYVAGDPAGAARDMAEALPLFRQAGDRQMVGTTLGNLGYHELAAGDLDAARTHLADSLDIARALNDRDGITYQTFNLGLAEYLGGPPGAAEASFAESLDLARRMGMKRQTAYALIGLAMAGHGGDGPGWSARLHCTADQALADLDETLEPLEGRLAGLDRQRLRAAMGADAFEAEYAAGRTLDLARAAHQALQGLKAGRGATRGYAGTRTGHHRIGCGRDGADSPRAGRAQARRAGTEQPRHRPAAFPERAHRPPAPGQHPAQARSLLARRGRGLGHARGPHLTPPACGARRPFDLDPPRARAAGAVTEWII